MRCCVGSVKIFKILTCVLIENLVKKKKKKKSPSELPEGTKFEGDTDSNYGTKCFKQT